MKKICFVVLLAILYVFNGCKSPTSPLDNIKLPEIKILLYGTTPSGDTARVAQR